MPMLDMPLGALETYSGINPKPEDFDAYWQAALSEMHALGTAFTLEPASFAAPTVDCFDLYFTGVHGARVHAKLLRPKGAKNSPAALAFHGYSGLAGDFSQYLAYAASGFVVAAMDCRGQGGKSEDVGGVKGNTLHGHIIRGLDDPDPHRLLMRDIFLDTAQLARIVMDMPEVDATRVGAYGGSQGGALTLSCAALEPRIKKLAPVYPFLCDYKRVWEMDISTSAYSELREYFRRFDPRHEREEAVFTKLGYIDIQYLAPRIEGDVLMFTGLMDDICPPSTQFAAYNKITAKKSIVIYPDFGHENLPDSGDMTFAHMMAL